MNTFQDQERVKDLDIEWIQFKWRNHDPAIGRFFNIDPLAESFYYNSTYAFSENKVVSHFELEGLEAVESNYYEDSNGKARHESTYTASSTVDRVTRRDPTVELRRGMTPREMVENGVLNTTFGTIGAIGSGAYSVSTVGAGAALGGGIAFSLSLGEVAIGLAQITDGVNQMFTGQTNFKMSGALQSSGSLLGLVGYGLESENAPLLDATGQMLPALFSGNLGLFDSFNRLKQTKSVTSGLNFYDANADAIGLGKELYNLVDSGPSPNIPTVNPLPPTDLNTGGALRADANRPDWNPAPGKGLY